MKLAGESGSAPKLSVLNFQEASNHYYRFKEHILGRLEPKKHRSVKIKLLSFGPDDPNPKKDKTKKSRKRAFGYKTVIDQIEERTGYRLQGVSTDGRFEEQYLPQFIFKDKKLKLRIQTTNPAEVLALLDEDPFAISLSNEGQGEDISIQASKQPKKKSQRAPWSFRRAHLIDGESLIFEYTDPRGETVYMELSPSQLYGWHQENFLYSDRGQGPNDLGMKKWIDKNVAPNLYTQGHGYVLAIDCALALRGPKAEQPFEKAYGHSIRSSKEDYSGWGSHEYDY